MAERTPTFEEAYAAHRAGDYAAAERGYLAHSRSVNALQNLGGLYADWGRLEQAERVLSFLLEQRPHHHPARHSLGMVYLAQGRWREGWALYEARLDYDPRYRIAEPACPRWGGEPLHGLTLAVLSEQGFGDQLQWSRFVPLAPAARTILVPSPELHDLFAGAELDVVHEQPGAVPAEADRWTWLCSLTKHLEVTPDTVPPPLDLRAPRRAAAGIGVMAAGRPEHPHNRARSLSGADAQRLLALGRDLSPAATGARDFAATAEIISGLSLVVTVDTAVAHLAGSLGVPTWVLLPARGLDWRWYPISPKSVWYPSVRLFRQREGGTWAEVLDQVEAEIGALHP